MRTFLIIWLGQIASTIGSFMTVFALTIWVWDKTGSATALALVGFFSQFPKVLITTFAGIAVDKFNRRLLMIVAEVVAMLCTLTIAMLYLNQQLEVWHLYVIVTLYGGFGQLQLLAYSASISLLVPKEQFTRAESLGSAVKYSAAIFAPALAGFLYPRVGMQGIFWIDLATFATAFVTLLIVTIPQPVIEKVNSNNIESNWEKLTFGFRYIWANPSLTAMAIAFTLFAFPNDISKALYSPMLLARTGGNSEILGTVTSAAGIGGVIGALILSIWGGFHRRIHGMLLGFIGYGFFRTILGLGQTLPVWIITHFLASLLIPLFYSSSNAIWYAKVPPSLQGRVLAADQLIGVTVSATTFLVAGFLADRVFEPAMSPTGSLAPIFGNIFGTDTGAGITLLFVTMTICTVLVGIFGYNWRTLRQVEDLIPDQKLPEIPPS
ncbi:MULTISPECIES: MFS transporter [Cyanophyceae]|uniref:MFS transporter n=1 Tax=Cyanophyceae TaxID=3028117 RepID=UPI00232BCCEA|nr:MULTISPECIES: MFS transporter [Cyanophyceae]MDB9356017.1 MFS transporter [Nodularia spumigena CS-587/03]MDB9341628.1 MFS transporter [Nodularia spumigena CS-589/07]MDB9346673.1 MFS transporter [Nodularia spumigena CS-588/01]MDB9354516.1 MFS transporter [Nodularia spumigena CS-588/05]MDB9402664.1 MFS transporter [Microcystis aeruginosa CS-567/02-A1]